MKIKNIFKNFPYGRPDSSVENVLVKEFPLIGLHVQKLPSDLESPGEVDVVVAAPETCEDGGDVERSVSHDVELFPAE